MRFIWIWILLFVACDVSEGRVHRDAGVTEEVESTLDCMSWFHECNCSYSCTTRGAYNGRLENGEANCEEACDDESIANVPSESCEDVDGVCQWVSE